MSEDISQDNWDGVYYEKMSGEFFLMEVIDDGVTLHDAFTGHEHETLDFAEFEDLVYDDEFEEVSPDVVRDPAATAEAILHEATSAVSGGSTKFATYWNPTDVDFAITATNLSFDDDAPYLETVE